MNHFKVEALEKDNGKQAVSVAGSAKGRQAPGSNTIGRFETDILTQRENNITTKLTGGNGAQRSSGQVERLVGLIQCISC